jgi:hypothetical protein
VQGLRPGPLRFTSKSPFGQNSFRIIRVELNGRPEGDALSVSDGQNLTGVRIVLAYGAGIIRGYMTVQGGTLPDGTAVRVSAQSTGISPVRTSSGWVDTRGRFEIRGLVDGRYVVSAPGVPGAKAFPQIVTVADGQAPEITVVLDMIKKE